MFVVIVCAATVRWNYSLSLFLFYFHLFSFSSRTDTLQTFCSARERRIYAKRGFMAVLNGAFRSFLFAVAAALLSSEASPLPATSTLFPFSVHENNEKYPIRFVVITDDRRTAYDINILHSNWRGHIGTLNIKSIKTAHRNEWASSGSFKCISLRAKVVMKQINLYRTNEMHFFFMKHLNRGRFAVTSNPMNAPRFGGHDFMNLTAVYSRPHATWRAMNF